MSYPFDFNHKNRVFLMVSICRVWDAMSGRLKTNGKADAAARRHPYFKFADSGYAALSTNLFALLRANPTSLLLRLLGERLKHKLNNQLAKALDLGLVQFEFRFTFAGFSLTFHFLLVFTNVQVFPLLTDY